MEVTKERIQDATQRIHETSELANRVDEYMKLKYRVSLDELEQAKTPGYWQDKKPKMHPGHPLHQCIGCEGEFRSTYTYFDSPRIKGRFASQTRTWLALLIAKNCRDNE